MDPSDYIPSCLKMKTEAVSETLHFKETKTDKVQSIITNFLTKLTICLLCITTPNFKSKALVIGLFICLMLMDHSVCQAIGMEGL
jgi:hypothetical protein